MKRKTFDPTTLRVTGAARALAIAIGAVELGARGNSFTEKQIIAALCAYFNYKLQA